MHTHTHTHIHMHTHTHNYCLVFEYHLSMFILLPVRREFKEFFKKFLIKKIFNFLIKKIFDGGNIIIYYTNDIKILNGSSPSEEGHHRPEINL